MTDHCLHQSITLTDGERVVTSAEITTSQTPHGTARAVVHAESGHLDPGSRAALVDAVLDLPEVSASAHLQATVTLGDFETLQRLRERCSGVMTRAAGSTALVEADLTEL
ncbi:MAG: hypothetical protein ACR2KJ_02550 [Jatrophihabitans sp.]